MPSNPVLFLKEGGQGEIVEKRSRFIATVMPVTTESEAQEFIDRMKKQYWDARHNCSAFVLGDNAEITRCSDDGEPPHTAGRPMLDVLLASGIRNVAVVVTRYFGGILLGTGGLVRAYREATLAGLQNCKTAKKQTGIPVEIVTDYNGIGKLLFLTGKGNYPVLNTVYADTVTLTVILPNDGLNQFLAEVNDATAGKAVCTAGDPVSYIISDSPNESPKILQNS